MSNIALIMADADRYLAIEKWARKRYNRVFRKDGPDMMRAMRRYQYIERMAFDKYVNNITSRYNVRGACVVRCENPALLKTLIE